jgi:hypothetical protein
LRDIVFLLWRRSGRRWGFEFGVWGSGFDVRCSEFQSTHLPPTKVSSTCSFCVLCASVVNSRSEIGVWGSVFTKGCHLAGFLTPVTPGLLNFCSLCLCGEFPFGVQSSEFEVRRALRVALNGASHHLTPNPNPIPTFESSVSLW